MRVLEYDEAPERPLGKDGIYGCDSRGLHGQGGEGEKAWVRVWISVRHCPPRCRTIYLPSSLAGKPLPNLSNSLNSKFADSSESLSKSTSTPVSNSRLRIYSVAVLRKYISGGFFE